MRLPREETDSNVLAAISTLTDREGVPPTVREVAAFLGTTSMSSVHKSLSRLREAGRVTWHPGSARTLVVVEEDDGHERRRQQVG